MDVPRCNGELLNWSPQPIEDHSSAWPRPRRGDEEEGVSNHSADALSAVHGRDGSGQNPWATRVTEPGSAWSPAKRS